MTDPVVRVRGIYATAVSVALDAADVDVVDPSPPVAQRLGGDFPSHPPNVVIESTDDRLGLELTGVP